MHFHRRQHHLSLTLAFTILLCPAGTARGQTSADLTLVSEYAGRGAALNTTAAPQLRVEHDVENDAYAGWYAGGFASPVRFDGRAQAQLIAYGGRAQRLTSTLSWDAGVTRSAFLRDERLNYHEFYAGLALQRVSARLFYSPSYYGEGRSAYLDLNGAVPLGERLHLAVHAGLLHPFEEDGGTGVDLRIALGLDVGDVSFQAGWQVKAHAYLAVTPPARALTISASQRF